MIRRLLLVFAVLALAVPVHAGVVTCSLQKRILLQGAMLVATNVTMSTSYSTGGDTFSSANALADVSNCLCGDPHYKPISVDISNVKGGTPPASSVDVFAFDQVNNKIQAFTALNTEAGAVNLSAFILNIQALCI